MRLSVRSRFALAAGALVLLVATAVAVAGYVSLRQTLHDQAARTVSGRAAQLAAVIDSGGSEKTSGQEGNYLDIHDSSLVSQFAGQGVWILVAGPTGKVLQASTGAPSGLGGRWLMASCRSRGTAARTLSQPAAALACRRVGSAAKPVGFVVAAAPLSDAQRTLAATRRTLAIGVLVGSATSVLLAWLLAARAMRPVRRIAQTARSIREGDLSRRIGYAGRDELGELAAELDAGYAELENAMGRQERFVADASHELKTPLAAARANVQLLRRWAATEPEPRADALAAIERSTARMSRVVNDLLQLAHGDDRLRYSNEPVRLDDVVLEAAREAQALAEGVRVVVDRVEQVVVLGDWDRLAQLLGNLVDNALRATSRGGTVRLTLEQVGDDVQLSVCDQGPGIPEHQLPYLFERFYRGLAVGQEDGSGLGLAIARAIARAHGGEIEVLSNVGVGSVFTVVLPRAELSSDRHPGFTGRSPAGANVGVANQGGKYQ